MQLVFNPLSDSPQAPFKPINNGEAYQGLLAVGPNGLLQQLGLYLGVSTKVDPEPVRVDQYREALEELSRTEPDVFYKQSFEREPISVAQTLLNWRDTLMMAGWNFSVYEGTPERLGTLARLEEQRTLSPGTADRWQFVKERLQTGYQVPLSEVHVVVPRAYTPPFFQSLLDLLAEKQVGISYKADFEPQAADGTDLAQFQQFLLSSWKGKGTDYKQSEDGLFQFQGDGSLVLLQANTETELAQYTASLLKANHDFRPLLLSQAEHGSALSEALYQHGLPATQERYNMAMSPIPQQFLLLPQLLWDPIDPDRLLEFLTLPDNPLPQGLCRRLAEVVSEKPGRQSEDWFHAIEKYLTRVETHNGKDEREKLQQKVDYWLHHELYPEDQGIPVEVLQRQMQALRQWAITKSQNITNPAPYQTLVNMANGIDALLAGKAGQKLDRLNLDKWLSQVYQDHWQEFQPPQVGSLPAVHSPEAIREPVGDLLWWGFTNDVETAVYRDWWREQERQHLEDQGVRLWPYKDRKQAEEYSTRAALSQVRNRLILVIPEKMEGEALSPHPFFGDLEATAGDLSPITYKLEMSQLPDLPGLQKPITANYPSHHLPASTHYWFSNQTASIQERDNESYSSLNNLFTHPYIWVLQHKAKVAPGPLFETTDLNRLKGSLAHRAAEMLFTDEQGQGLPELPKPNDVRQWMHEELKDLLEREGSILLLKGYQKEKVQFQQELEQGLTQLARIFHEQEWEVESMEHRFPGAFDGTAAEAIVDLILKTPAGQRLLIDMKWGGKFMDKLRNESDLQLALYAGLVAQEGQPVPAAYYIISKGQLVSRYGGIFPENVYTNPMDTSEADAIQHAIWNRMVNTYQFRLGELKQGYIEVGDGLSLNELAASEQMDGEHLIALPRDTGNTKKPARYSPFKHLIEAK
jgi:hypothetical protein